MGAQCWSHCPHGTCMALQSEHSDFPSRVVPPVPHPTGGCPQVPRVSCPGQHIKCIRRAVLTPSVCFGLLPSLSVFPPFAVFIWAVRYDRDCNPGGSCNDDSNWFAKDPSSFSQMGTKQLLGNCECTKAAQHTARKTASKCQLPPGHGTQTWSYRTTVRPSPWQPGTCPEQLIQWSGVL
jgi:hypothetical protein